MAGPIRVTLGADPELGVVDAEGRPVESTRFKKIRSDAQFGRDGCNLIFELRPDPADTPYGLIQNIRKCISEGYGNLKHEFDDYRLVAGSVVGSWAIGGHIHLGNMELLRDNNFTRVKDCLNYLVGPTLALLEPKSQFLGRRATGYGGLWSDSDLRTQPHGAEYRVPSSWLTSPAVAQGAIGLAHIVATNFDDIHKKHGAEIAKSITGLRTAFNSFDTTKLGNHVMDKVLPILKEQPNYSTYEREINFIINDLVANKLSWYAVDENVLAAWGFRDRDQDKIIVKKVLAKMKAKEVVF